MTAKGKVTVKVFEPCSNFGFDFSVTCENCLAVNEFKIEIVTNCKSPVTLILTCMRCGSEVIV